MAALFGLLNRDRLTYKERTNGNVISEQERGLLKDATISVEDGKHYINRGEPDQMEYSCYTISAFRSALTYVFIVLTGGLLRLVFHWVPHWYLRARCVPSDVQYADFILITEFYNDKHKIRHVKPMRRLSISEAISAANSAENLLDLDPETTKAFSVHFEGGTFEQLERLVTFRCKKVTYVLKPGVREFVKLRGLDHQVPSESLHQHRGISRGEQFLRRLIYDRNEIVVKESSVGELLFLEVLNPFYIFQLASFILWFADNYYYYAAAILLMSAFGISMTVIQTRRNQRNLKSTVHSSDVSYVQQRLGDFDSANDAAYRTELISTDLLVPGDILEIPPNGCIMQCDAILLTGNCILNESMLTGESVPVTKTPLPNLHDVHYDPKEHARHTLFCGTQVIQTRYFGDEKVLAIVIRTGFATAKGGLVRSILYPPPVDFRFEKDSYRFVALLAFIAGIGFVYTVITKVVRGVSPGDIIVEALDLITIAVPPALPAAMTVGRLYAQTRLQKDQIFCISPRSINVAGSIDCVCFDKTGTLTEDGLDLLCVVPISSGSFNPRVTKVAAELRDDKFLNGLVSCHSLTIIDKQLTGDPLDLKMFESTGWSMEEPEISDNTKFDMLFPTVFKPPCHRTIPTAATSSPTAIARPSDCHDSGHDDNDDTDFDDDPQPANDNVIEFQIGKIREFPFSSSSQRMGVIIRQLGAPHFEYYCKGSPEMVLTFVRDDSVPADFGETLERYTEQGYRVIALAHKQLKLSYAKVQKVRRENLETQLTLLGLIVLENRLKPESTPSIRRLNDAHIRVIMVTGDNILTAVSVARDCGIITPGQAVITVNAAGGGGVQHSFSGTTVPMMMNGNGVGAGALSSPPQLYYTLAATKNTATRNDLSLLSNTLSVRSLETVESQLPNSVSTAERKAVAARPASLYNNYRFAITGKVWSIIKNDYPELIPRLITRGSIFARMAPDQKQQLIEELQGLGYYVAMCGDGANDCGALKAAHTGISLSEAESSVASPFTSKNPDITCVLNIIKEGRAALVTSFGIFKYMAAYSLCQFVSVMILYSIDSNLTDIEFLYIDLFIISIFAFFFGRTAAYRGDLVKQTPLNSLISFSPVLSLLLQTVIVIGFQVLSFKHLQSEEWYTPFNATMKEDKDEVGCVENYTIFTMSGFQYIILAIVFSKGPPYRESIFTNYGFIVSAILLTAFSIYLALDPTTWLAEQFDLILPESFTFRLYLLLYAALQFIGAILCEVLVIDHWVFKRLRFRFHNVDKSKRKFLRIERDLAADVHWPTLFSDTNGPGGGTGAGVASSACTTGSGDAGNEAVIIERREGDFDRNHVLNGLCRDATAIEYAVDDDNDDATTVSDSGEFYQSADTPPTSGRASALSSHVASPITPLYRRPVNHNNNNVSDASFQTARTAPHLSVPNTPLRSLSVTAASAVNDCGAGGWSLPGTPRSSVAGSGGGGAGAVSLTHDVKRNVLGRRTFSDFESARAFEMKPLDDPASTVVIVDVDYEHT